MCNRALLYSDEPMWSSAIVRNQILSEEWRDEHWKYNHAPSGCGGKRRQAYPRLSGQRRDNRRLFGQSHPLRIVLPLPNAEISSPSRFRERRGDRLLSRVSPEYHLLFDLMWQGQRHQFLWKKKVGS